ncbi:pentapeptide repeat-containing protein [Streptosporangium sp. NPDC023825]|uniref:pentapeptide repeat-containing protein n=1 Tax=Streptosporangium sp. NPDC023825 TaxID=3154909 RepID=UPI00344389C8
MRRQAAGRADLRGTSFRGTNLRRTGLRETNLRGTVPRGTVLPGTDRGLLLPRRLPEPPAAPARRHRGPGRPAAAGSRAARGQGAAHPARRSAQEALPGTGR